MYKYTTNLKHIRLLYIIPQIYVQQIYTHLYLTLKLIFTYVVAITIIDIESN